MVNKYLLSPQKRRPPSLYNSPITYYSIRF